MRTLIAVALTLSAAPAAAQVPPEAGCAIRSPGINFGVYSALDRTPQAALGLIEVACFPPAETLGARITLSAGRSGQPLERTLTNGGATLRYNLYADPAHNRVLGDGSNGTVEPQSLTRNLGRSLVRVYGVIWPGQRVPAGEYSDNVRIEVEF